MKKSILSVCLFAATVQLSAAVSVTSQIVRPRWPFERKVDVWFELSGVTDPVDIVFGAKSGETALDVPKAALSGDLHDLGNGPHHLVFDPAAANLADTTAIEDFSVTLGTTAAKTYMIVNLDPSLENTVAARVTYSASVIGSSTNAVGGPAWDDVYKTDKLVMRRIPAGTCTLGSPAGRVYRASGWVETQRLVRITRPFYIGVFEVTQRQCEILTGSTSSFFTNATCYAKRPVDNGNYTFICGFANGYPQSWYVGPNDYPLAKLRACTGGKITFHLPSEAEWEYACRAGNPYEINVMTASETGKENYSGFSAARKRAGWFDDRDAANPTNAERNNPLGTPGVYGTQEVGRYAPNAWGLYDMHGNVAEWTRDWFNETYGTGTEVTNLALIDPAPTNSTKKVDKDYCRAMRGGGYAMPQAYNTWQRGRSCGRFGNRPDGWDMPSGTMGFRVWCSADFAE